VYHEKGILMKTGCENCGKSASSSIEFNSVLLCPECFEKEIKRIAADVIEP
jgi:hypothetical protein